MRKSTTYRSRFTKNLGRDINSSATTLPPASPSFKLYRSIHSLPLINFITCICDDDLTALIREGTATAEQLAAAWETIYNEYLEAIKDDNSEYIDKLTKDYNLLHTKYNVIKLLVEALAYAPVDYLIEQLKQWYELPVVLDPKDKPAFKKALALISARNQRWLNDALQIRQQIIHLLPEQKDDVKITRTWFDEHIVALSKFSKYHINKNETTVSEFVIMIKDMKATAKAALREYSKN